ncbi:MAG: hypothetical protein IPI43_13010 [Sandaracinaceae bacterium]|nr:hypothetical protein [Sandaracinaceae bacterium]
MRRRSTRSMTPAVLGLLSMLGCAEATVQRVDASADSATADVRQAALATWRALDDAAETPGTYWYEEHNCPLMLTTGTASVVQVANGAAALVGRRVVCGSTCEQGLERYYDFVPATLPMLIATCPADATVELDVDGVLTLCRLRAPDCDDSCDTGFHVVHWEHGVFDGDATTDEECAP